MYKFDFWLKWTATAVTILFAIMTAAQCTPYNVWVANASCALWLWWSLRIREWSLVVVNGVLLAVYLVGVILS